MKDPLKRAIFGLMLFSGICPAKDFSIDFNPISPYTPIPRLLYAFSARNQVDRYNLQAMRQGLGVKRPDDPPATSRMLDSLLNLFKGYDTAAAYDSLKKKDDFCLTSKLNRITAQMFVLDVENLRAALSAADCSLDSADTVFMRWKGTFVNHSQTRKRIDALFQVAHAGHLFFVVRDTTANTLSMDTVLKPYYGAMSWFRSVGFCKFEFGVSVEFNTYDSLADCEIRTDYFGLTFHFNDSGVPTPTVEKNDPKGRTDGLAFRPAAHGGFIRFYVDKPCASRLTIHSLSGGLVYRATSGPQPAGICSVFWNGGHRCGRPAGPGAYLVSVEGGGLTVLRKTIVLR